MICTTPYAFWSEGGAFSTNVSAGSVKASIKKCLDFTFAFGCKGRGLCFEVKEDVEKCYFIITPL